MRSFSRLIGTTLIPTALLGSMALLAAGCSSDSNGNDGGPDASSGGRATGGTSSGGAGGAAGKATGGAAGSGGTATGGKSGGGAGGADASAPADAGTDASDSGSNASPDTGPGPEAVLCGDAGSVTNPLLVAGTTFCDTCTTSEVAAIDTAHGCVIGRATFDDTDIVPRVSGGHAFVIQRTNGVLSTLSPSARVTASIPLGPHVDAGAEPLNPHDVVYAAPASGPKAYVSLYGPGAIAVVDLASGAVTSRIDLASFKDASDTDGSSDPDVGFYDATKSRAYFVLQRTDLLTSVAPNFIIGCPPAGVPSELIAIDTTNDTLVDLNGASAGVGLPLSFVAPADVAVDGRRVLIHSNGCGDATGKRIKAGVESVDLDTLVDTALYTSQSGFLDRLVRLSSTSVALQSFDDNFTTLWNLWDPTTTTLGAALDGVPDFAVAENATTLIGVGFDVIKPRVKRFHVDTKSLTTVVSAPWAGNYQSTAGVALVK
jgi:hypothetical protein